MSEQLQNCRTILTLDATIATLWLDPPRIRSERILTGGRYGSLRQIDVAQETMAMISSKDPEIKDAITTTDQQLAGVNEFQTVAVRSSGPEPSHTPYVLCDPVPHLTS